MLTSDISGVYALTVATFAERIGQRVRELRAERDWNQADLADAMTAHRRKTEPNAAQVSIDTISRVENGGNTTTDTIEMIAAAFSESVDGILRGPSEVEEVPIDVSGYRAFDIPVIAEGDASPSGVLWDEDGKPLAQVDEWMSRPDDPAVRDPSCYAIVVRGDSMEPLIRRGMRLIISPNIPVSDGDVAYVILKSHERLVKVVHKHQGGWVLESYNRDYPPRFALKNEVEAIHRVAYIRTLK